MPDRHVTATVHTVAEAAGVSAQTVSRVLNGTGYVSEKTRARVLKVIERTGYRRNTVGRSLRAARTPTIAFLISDITNPFYARIYKSMEPLFRDRELTIMLLNCDDDPDLERRQLDLLASYRPTGLVISPAAGSTLSGADLPSFNHTVLVSRILDIPGVPSVVTNEAEAMSEATGALLDAGHRHILAILGREHTTTTRNREAGIRRALTTVPQADLVVRYTDQTSAGAHSAGRAALHADPTITAVIGFNAQVTEGILTALDDLGLDCPADVSVVGFTDAGWMAVHRPPISVVAQPVEQMGRLAADLLLDLIDGREVMTGPHVVPGSFIERASVGPPRHAAPPSARSLRKSR